MVEIARPWDFRQWLLASWWAAGYTTSTWLQNHFRMPELAVIAPTYNERENLAPLLEALARVLGGIDYEVVIVDDDSPDGTAELARELAQNDPRVRVIHRIHRRGLASAVVEGMMASSAPYLAVMDADLQHDETVLPSMFEQLRREDLDLVVGTRHTEGGSMGTFPALRVRLSDMGKWLSHLICRTELSDPMSGFFVVRRSVLSETVHRLSAVGFKILLDLVASSPRPLRIAEVGYTFRERLHGRSKLDIVVSLEYLELLFDKLFGDWIPVRYTLFGMVGAIGVGIQVLLVYVLSAWANLTFDQAQAAASWAVIFLNFYLNNQLAFRQNRLRGWRSLSGLAIFVVGCSIGLVANLRVAHLLWSMGVFWPMASLAGILIGSVWNYGVSCVFVWQVNRRQRAGTAMRALQNTSGPQ